MVTWASNTAKPGLLLSMDLSLENLELLWADEVGGGVA
jgi:hypothetical protein